MKKYSLILCLIGFVSSHATTWQPEEGDTTKAVDSLDIANIQLADLPLSEYLDSLMVLNFFQTDSTQYSTGNFAEADSALAGVIPDFPDSVYQRRLEVLNAQTPLDLDFNIYVKRYIDMYTKRRRDQVSRMLGLAEFYYPLFEESLDQYNIPLELKHLAIVESALNPLARSRVGATGLWQFMYATGKLNDLNVSSYIDERSDPIKSTQAACKYLSQLYSIFGDWNLVLAAYNSGPGNVNKAIRRSGGKKNYWQIRSYLPRETAGYVPAFIAVNYIMNYAPEHYIYPKGVKASYFDTDTISIKQEISFEQIADLMDLDIEELQFLNPAYRYKIIPKKKKGYYSLMLPSSKMGLFVTNEDSIYAIAKRDFAQKQVSLPKYVEMNDRVRHRVRSGEFLGSIARKYGVSVRSLKRWNGLRSDNIRVGQRLTIHPRRMPTTASTNTHAKTKSNTKKSAPKPTKIPSGDYRTYTVKSGDSFYSIARNYPGISAQNIMDWNNISNAKRLKPGMSLKIYSGS